MSIVIEIMLVVLLAVGSAFVLVGAFGLVRLSEFFKRLHGPTKASTLGVGCLLVASVSYHTFIGSDPQPRELLITAFLFITAPISAFMMAKAGLSLRMDDMPQLPGRAEDTHVPERPDHAPDERE
ncbi:Na+/H+ antiporter subunit G [Arenimonas caeni]|jgi:multicomponent K+:H+ antiporter subunit G|uniref:Na+/H+ antiporter subunit G n=1 Tax=Arenimonas caeni TaxID=2058085 RepID=A0A2P6M8W3_9GAMM|nr:Na+/H+ antiporter subunit G [Arenimonas caeni]MDY0022403.1 Na+/H+ antiporter subunit G [Arenimonas caeni]PRH82434.1 Na+/H+ antiporter subunit G [Arenimonas caeni]